MKECPDIRFDGREARESPSLSAVVGRPEHIEVTKTRRASREEPDEARRGSRRANPASSRRVSAYQVMTEAS